MDYVSPKSTTEASEALSKTGAYALAGGTDLLVKLKMRTATPSIVVDIKSVPKIQSIEPHETGWWIGAATSCSEISEHEALKNDWPGVVEALSLIGSTQIQGRASLGGNLCNASPAADSIPALIAAGATCEVASINGERTVAVEDVVTSPGKTCLNRGEFVVGFNLPKPGKRSGDAYLRMIPRTEMDIAIVGAGVCIEIDKDGKCKSLRVALGAIAPTQLLLAEAEEIFLGHTPNEERINRLVQIAEEACKPIDDKRGTIEYRTKVAGVLTKRAFSIALERAMNK